MLLAIAKVETDYGQALAIRERDPDHPDIVATRRALEELAGGGGGRGDGGG